MCADFTAGDIVYSGYPTSFVFNFERNSKKQLRFSKQKHLLWGDWVKVTDYDFMTEDSEERRAVEALKPLTSAERTYIAEKIAGMIPVRVRGVNGYMDPEDLHTERLLEIVFVDVGQGDGALMVTPDDRKYVIDAGVGDNMYRYLRWRFAGFDKAHHDFDGLIITHPDKDHYYGFQDLIEDEEVRARQIWHNGIMEQFKVSGDTNKGSKSDDLLGKKKTVSGQEYLTDLIQTDDDLSDFLGNELRWVSSSSGRAKMFPSLMHTALTAVKDGERRFPSIAMMSTAHGVKTEDGKTWLPGFAPDGDKCQIELLGPVVEEVDGGSALRVFSDKPREKTTSMNTGKTKNGHSILLKLNYRDLNVLFGGDLNSSAEMFLLNHYTGLSVYDPIVAPEDMVIGAGAKTFGVDVAKACHHGSADFTDIFLACVAPAATVISSGDEEGHAHPRSDTLGAIGHNGRGKRSLVFSTELFRSTREYTDREDTPWYQAAELRAEAEEVETDGDADYAAELIKLAEALEEQTRVTNVTVYGSINLRSDGRRVVIAYMLEKPSDSKRWDVYTLESLGGGPLRYRNAKEAADAEEKRRKAARTTNA